MDINIPFDETDPFTFAVTLFLTWLLRLLPPSDMRQRLQLAAPLLAFLLALAIRALVDTVSGEPLSLATLLRGLAAAGVAVLTSNNLDNLSDYIFGSEPPKDGGA